MCNYLGVDMPVKTINTFICTIGAGLLIGGCTTIAPAGDMSRPAPNIEISKSIKTVETIANDLAQTHGVANVLIVFDIDDTLLANTSDVGSTAWWNWQSSLPTTSTDKIPFPALLADGGALFALSDMKPAEGQVTIDVFKRLSADGFPMHALTARGPDNRDATLRELADQGLIFTTAPECGAPLCVKRGRLPGDMLIAPLARKRFSFAEGAKTRDLGAGVLKLSSGRNASVGDGVMMVSGQNKGIMLRLLVDSFPAAERPKAIIFVDDSAKNVADVKAASPLFNETLRIVHYQALTHEQADFQKSRARQSKAMADLKRIANTVCTVLNNQAQLCER